MIIRFVFYLLYYSVSKPISNQNSEKTPFPWQSTTPQPLPPMSDDIMISRYLDIIISLYLYILLSSLVVVAVGWFSAISANPYGRQVAAQKPPSPRGRGTAVRRWRDNRPLGDLPQSGSIPQSAYGLQKFSWLSLWGERPSVCETEGASGNRQFDKAKTSAGSSRHASRATLLSEEGKAVAIRFHKCSCLPRLEGGGPPLGGGGIIAQRAICRKAAVSPSQPTAASPATLRYA